MKGLKSIVALLCYLQCVFGQALLFPNCSAPCLGPILTPAVLSNLTGFAQTLCSNTTIQSGLSKCVQMNCEFSEQAELGEFQAGLCAPFPKPSRSHEIKTVAAVFSAITFPIVGLKFYTRYQASSQLWADDYAALVAAIVLAVIAGVQIASSTMGLGLHYWNVSASDGVELQKLFYASQISYVIIQVAAKASLLLLFLRVFTRPWFTIACKICIGFLVTHGTAYILVIIFQCRPISAVWNLGIVGKCVDMFAFITSGAIFSIIEDIVILLLPIPEFMQLQMDSRKKWGLAFMFSLGSFACVTSIVRLKYVLQFSRSFDPTWDNVDIIKWSLIEEFSAVLCATLPSLRAFFKQTFKLASSSLPTFGSGTGNRSRSQSKSGYIKSSGSHPLQNLQPSGKKGKSAFSESTTELKNADPNVESINSYRRTDI